MSTVLVRDSFFLQDIGDVEGGLAFRVHLEHSTNHLGLLLVYSDNLVFYLIPIEKVASEECSFLERLVLSSLDLLREFPRIILGERNEDSFGKDSSKILRSVRIYADSLGRREEFYSVEAEDFFIRSVVSVVSCKAVDGIHDNIIELSLSGIGEHFLKRRTQVVLSGSCSVDVFL